MHFLLLSSFLVASCDYDDDHFGPTPDSIYGTWKITDVLEDPGDGSGSFVPAEYGRVITFNRDSTYRAYAGLNTFAPIRGPEYGVYRPDEAVIVVPNDSINNHYYPYQVAGLTLTLIYTSCRDSCAERYVKVRD